MSCWVLLRIFLCPKVLASVDKAAEDLSAGLRRLWRRGFDPSLIVYCSFLSSVCCGHRSQFLWGDHGLAMA